MDKQWKFISDVDGVLTDGKYLYSKQGKEYKMFGAHDNDGAKLLKQAGKRRTLLILLSATAFLPTVAAPPTALPSNPITRSVNVVLPERPFAL